MSDARSRISLATAGRHRDAGCSLPPADGSSSMGQPALYTSKRAYEA
jgi:hypothetical protein